MLMLTLCLPVLAGAMDYLEPRLLTGSIYDKAEGGQLLFTFRRTASQTGDMVGVVREFRYPNGSIAARERVTYQRGRLTRFELEEIQIGATGVATISQGNIDFEYVANGKRKRNTEAVADEPLTADSVGPFLAAHWDELNRGETVKFRYLVVPRLETIAFKLASESPGDFKGKKVIRIKMTPSSWVVSKMLDPLTFTVEADPPHRVLQYWGRTTPKLRSGNSWRDLDALSVFDWSTTSAKK